MSDSNPIDDSLQSLIGISPREYIRKRPGMYFSSMDKRGLHVMVWTIVDNSITQAVQGKCNCIQITLDNDNKITIHDDGPGIPVDFYPKRGKRILEIIMTEPGGKHLNLETNTFRGGIFGGGLAAVNAACEKMTLEVKRDGFLWWQDYREGIPQHELQPLRSLTGDEQTGTSVTFKPDFTIFEPNEFDYVLLYRRLRELAFLMPNLRIILEDKRTSSEKSVEFLYPNGIKEFVLHLNRDYQPLHPVITAKETFPFKYEGKPTGQTVELAISFQYVDVREPMVLSFVNTINVIDGGTHVQGVVQGLEDLINHYDDFESEVTKWRVFQFTETDVTLGLTAVIDIRHPSPDIEGYSIYGHRKMLNPELQESARDLVLKAFTAFAIDHPEDMKKIIEKCSASEAIRQDRRYGEMNG